MKEFFADIDDFYNSWEDFIWAVKKHKTKCNETYNEDLYVGLKVIELLLWYGIPIDEIPNIKLSDVSYDGIKGYDIIFDERTINLFMEYKGMKNLRISRGINERPTEYALKQDTFFRTIDRKSNDIVTDTTIRRSMSKLMKVEEDDEDLQKLFLLSCIYTNGSLCYVYDRLNDKIPKMMFVCRLASEFGYKFNAKSSDQTYFIKFKRYYKFRQKWEKEHTEQDNIEQSEQSEQTEQTEDIKDTLSETTRATAEEVEQLVDNIVNNPIPTDQFEEPKTEQENIVDICLDILSGLRTSISLINNQINTLESVLKTMK